MKKLRDDRHGNIQGASYASRSGAVIGLDTNVLVRYAVGNSLFIVLDRDRPRKG